MKRKPGVYITLLLTLILTIGFPSCGGPDYIALRDIERVEIYDRTAEILLYNPVSTASDSISLIVFNKLVGFATNYHYGLMQSAWATSPPDPELANEITDIRVSCDQPIFGIMPGENLSTELYFGISSNHHSPIGDFLEELPSKGDYYYWGLEEIFIHFDSKPQPGVYQFTIEIEDNNGHIFSDSPPSITWL